jgi:ABC-type cobalamin/Fe3+-siderophores transport system ATPase subunit
MSVLGAQNQIKKSIGNLGEGDVGHAFAVNKLGLTIDGRKILSDVTLEFPGGEVVALVGHNGSGKSSLLKILARQLAPTAGTSTYAGHPLDAYDNKSFARSVAYLPQDLGTGSDMTVRELVACGRYPWHGALGRFSAADREKVDAAMYATGIGPYADRLVGTLSGGERQLPPPRRAYSSARYRTSDGSTVTYTRARSRQRKECDHRSARHQYGCPLL